MDLAICFQDQGRIHLLHTRTGIQALMDTTGARTVAQAPTDILQPHSGHQDNGQEKDSIPGSSD
jgi:hypothetical protein